MQIEPLGDSGLLVRVTQSFDADKSLDAVLRATQQLEVAQIRGVIGLAPAYTTIGIFFDPTQVEAFDAFRTDVEHALESNVDPARSSAAATIVVPVCYENEFSPDLEAIGEHVRLSPDEVIRRHAQANYRVSCVGFTPGFPYLSGLPAELATPRRASPRKEIPAGAVAIGGMQTGIYPRKSPGGWNIIGRTPLRLFDVDRNPPSLFQAGDHVRFRKISRAEFDGFSG